MAKKKDDPEGAEFEAAMVAEGEAEPEAAEDPVAVVPCPDCGNPLADTGRAKGGTVPVRCGKCGYVGTRPA